MSSAAAVEGLAGAVGGIAALVATYPLMTVSDANGATFFLARRSPLFFPRPAQPGGARSDGQDARARVVRSLEKADAIESRPGGAGLRA
jgi:hypothetical protein